MSKNVKSAASDETPAEAAQVETSEGADVVEAEAPPATTEPPVMEDAALAEPQEHEDHEEIGRAHV